MGARCPEFVAGTWEEGREEDRTGEARPGQDRKKEKYTSTTCRIFARTSNLWALAMLPMMGSPPPLNATQAGVHRLPSRFSTTFQGGGGEGAYVHA